MPLQIRQPIEIELDPAPREREDRKQRTRLAEEMKKNFRRMVEERSERNRQLLREQRLRERGERPPSGPLRELAEAFAPPPSGAFQEAPLSAFPQLEEQRVQRGAEGARQFAEEVRGRPLEEVARIMGLAEVARQRRVAPQQLVAQPGATEAERVALQQSVEREAIPAFQRLDPVTAGTTIGRAINPFALEQKYIAKHTTPKFQAAFRATLGEALQAVGVSEERANQASDIGGVLLGQVALPTSVVPFVGTGGRLVKVLRAVTLGAGLSAAQEDAFIREFEGRDPELWEILLAAGAGGGGAGIIESGAIGGAFRAARGRLPTRAAGEVAEEVAPVAAREAAPPGRVLEPATASPEVFELQKIAEDFNNPRISRRVKDASIARAEELRRELGRQGYTPDQIKNIEGVPTQRQILEAEAVPPARAAGDVAERVRLGALTREEFDQAVLYRGVSDKTAAGPNEFWTDDLELARMHARGGANPRIRVMLREDIPKEAIAKRTEMGLEPTSLDEALEFHALSGLQISERDFGPTRIQAEVPVNVEPFDAIRRGPVRAAGEVGEGVPVQTAPEAPVPAQAVDDFEAIPREAIEASARDLPAVGGGAPGGFAVPLRPFADVAGEVVTRDDPIGQVLARSGASPGLLETSDVGKATVAFARQRGSAEQIINVTLASAVDSHRTGVGGRLPIAIGDDAIATLDDGTRVPWNDLFSTNQFDNKLTTSQRAFVGDYRRVVDEAEFLRIQAGLKPRAVKGAEAKEGWFYIPRQVRGIRGMELRRPSSPGLQRHYDEAIEGIKNGVKYESDPRAVLELHLRQAYREIAEKQMSDFLEPLSITPKELIPEPVLKRMSDAVQRRLAAERNLRSLRAERLRAQTGGQFVGEEAAAQRVVRVAKEPERARVAGAIKEAEAERVAAMAEYTSAKTRYSKALETARKAELAPGNLFGKAEDVIPIAQWRNRFFPLEDAERLNEALGAFLQSPKRANWAGRGFEQLGNHIRFLSAIGDFAAPFIQGLPLLGRNPVAWSRATWRHYQAFADPTIQAKFIREHIDTFQEMAQHNVPIGDVEFFKAIQEGQGISAGALIERLPKGKETRNLLRQAGKQTFGRFQASYDMFLSSARAQLWESMKPSWTGSLDELATHVRNMTGGLDSKALGVAPTQRGFESTWLAFSPRLLRSTVALVADLRLGLKNPRGRAAYQALGGLTAGTVGMYIASGIAMGKSEQEIRTGLNPLEGKKFLSHNINGDWVGVGGQVRAITQLLARSAADPASLRTLDQFENPLLQFMASRGAPGFRIAQTVGEAFTGADLLPFDDIDSLPDMFLHIGQSALPFAVQGLLEGEGVGTFITGLAGARTSPARRRERFDQLYREKFGEDPPEGMSPRTLDPDLAAQAGYTGETEFQEERREVTSEEEGRLAGLAQVVLRGNPQAMQQFSDELGDYFRFRSGVTDTLVRQFNLPEREASLVQAYYNLDPRDRRDPETGQPDYDFFETEQDRILQQLRRSGATQAATALERGTGVEFTDPDLQRVYDAQRELRQGLDVYYDTDPDQRERFRQRNEGVDARLYLLGRVSRVVSTRAQAEVRALSGRLLGTTIEASRGEQRGRVSPGTRENLLPGGVAPSRSNLLPGGRAGPSRSNLLP